MQNMQCFFFEFLLNYRENNLYTPVKISRHPVRTSHKYFRIAVIIKIENTAVLQKISHNGTHGNILTHSRNSDAQTADSAHDQINLYTACRCLIQCRNNARITEGIHFCHDTGFPSLLRVFCFPANQPQKFIPQPVWCQHQFIPCQRFGISG